jgi:hypothetical protein
MQSGEPWAIKSQLINAVGLAIGFGIVMDAVEG